MNIAGILIVHCFLMVVADCVITGMAQMRKLACDGIRTNSRGDLQVPVASARQEILTSLVSALDSVVRRHLPGAVMMIVGGFI